MESRWFLTTDFFRDIQKGWSGAVVDVSEDITRAALKKCLAQDLAVKRLSKGNRTFSRGNVLVL